MAPAPSRLAFIARRLVGLVAVLVIVSFLVFSLLYIAPGSPEQLVLGNSKTIDPATLHAVRQEYHLEGPFLVRYLDWAGSALRLDFGRSIRTSEPVRQGIAQRLALTSELAGIAFMMTLAFGTPLGVLAAVRRAQLVDRGVVFFSIVGLSAPAFATGILLLAGNAGGLLVAVLVGALVDQPSLAFAVLAVCMLGGLPAARRVSPDAGYEASQPDRTNA